jgi:hypothetical protein
LSTIRFTILAALALASGACTLSEVTIPASEELVVVEAVLRTDVDVQTIVLHRSLDGRDVRGVAGALVTVTPEGGAPVRFAETGTACYRYSPSYFQDEPGTVAASCYESPRGLREWVRPGTVYRLRVETQDGRTIQGRTRVPGAFRLTGFPYTTRMDQRQGAQCRLPPNTALTMAWTQSDSAWSYLIPMRAYNLRSILNGAGQQVDIPDPLELVGLAISQQDTTIVLPTEFGLFDRFDTDNDALKAIQNGFPAGVVVEVNVAAADRNYVNGVRGGRFNPSGPVRISSVVGDGVGVFGSLVPLYTRAEVAAQGPVPVCR